MKLLHALPLVVLLLVLLMGELIDPAAPVLDWALITATDVSRAPGTESAGASRVASFADTVTASRIPPSRATGRAALDAPSSRAA